jgi:hypothetical protein
MASFQDYYQQRFPSGAYLIHGPEKSTEEAWFRQQCGENTWILEADQDKNSLEKIRAIDSFLQMESLSSITKQVVIFSAHCLSAAAQNALLKPLEDVLISVHFWLWTPYPQRLLETLRSRLQVYRIQHLDLYQNRDEARLLALQERIKNMQDPQKLEKSLSLEEKDVFWLMLARYYPDVAWNSAVQRQRIPGLQPRLEILRVLSRIVDKNLSEGGRSV